MASEIEASRAESRIEEGARARVFPWFWERPLALAAGFLLLQLVIVIFASFIRQRPVFFIAPGPVFGWDYQAFYLSAQAWLHGSDPYSVPRYANGPPALVTPPPSMIAGLMFAYVSFPVARFCYLVFNIALITGSLLRLARFLGLASEQRWLLIAATLMYYPFYSVTERGNIDGFVLAGLVIIETTRRDTVRAFALGAITVMKIYPAVLLAEFARRRRFRTIAGTAAFAALLLLPFWRYLPSFVGATFARASRFQHNENISPASLFRYSGMPGWKVAFVAFWVITFALFLWRTRRDTSTSVFHYVPWMTSMPALVLSHSAILYLALLTFLSRNVQGRQSIKAERALLYGFLLTGVQAVPLGFQFSQIQIAWDLLYLCAPVGTMLIMLSVCAGALERPMAKESPDIRIS